MIKLPKPIAFMLFIAMTIFLAISFSNINWDVFETNYAVKDLYYELRETFMFLVLTCCYMLFYVKTLKPMNEK